MKSNTLKFLGYFSYFMLLSIFTLFGNVIYSHAETKATGGTLEAIFFEDVNGNHVQDLGEKGVPGVRVELFSGDTGKLLEVQETGNDGKYSFTNLNTGEYYIRLDSIPVGFEPFTNGGFGGDLSRYFRVNSGQTVAGPFMGLATTRGQIKGSVFYDENKDGKKNASEKGLNNVPITLVDDAQQTIAQTQTDSAGNYGFSELFSNKNYYVQINYPKEYEIVPTTYFNNSGRSASIFVEKRTVTSNVDLALYKDIEVDSLTLIPSSLQQVVGDTGTVIATILPANATNKKVTFTSENPDIISVDSSGRWTALKEGTTRIKATSHNQKSAYTDVKVTDKKESSVTGTIKRLDGSSFPLVKIQLYRGSGVLEQEVLTDSAGAYRFSSLSKGDYYLRIFVPNEYVLHTSEIFASDGMSAYFGLTGTNSLNHNTVLKDKEVLPTDITVVPNEIKTLVGKTGAITVSFMPTNTNVKDLTFTSNNPSIISVDSKGNWVANEVGTTSIIVRTKNGITKTIPVTVESLTDSTISGFIFDTENQGIQAVTVKLYLYSGELLKTTQTTVTGAFRFENLSKETYYIEFEEKEGYQATTKPGTAFWGTQTGYLGVNGKDSLQNINGYMRVKDKKQSVVSGKIINHDSSVGISGMKVTLYNAVTQTIVGETTTSALGTYQFSNLSSGIYYVGLDTANKYETVTGEFWGGYTGYLHLDGSLKKENINASLREIQLNQSVISGKITNQETGAGFSNVKLELYEAYTGQKLSETATAADGTYKFNKLGNNVYYMKLVLPNGFIIGESNAFWGDATGWLTVDGKNTLANQNASLVLEKKSDSVISGKITNQATGLGFSNVKINLFEAYTGNKLGETTTAADGTYKFGKLEGNVYYMQMVLPNGYVISESNAFWGDATGWLTVDGSNTLANQNASLIVEKKSNSIISGKITNQATGLGFSNVKINLFEAYTGNKLAETITAADGTYQFSKLEGNVYYMQMVLPNAYIIGESNAFWGDATGWLTVDGNNTLANQNASLIAEKKSNSVISGKITNQETGLGFSNVKVTLYEASTANKVAETNTAADGKYQFSKLEGNIYYMQLTLPNGYIIGESNAFWGDATGWLTVDGTNTLADQNAALILAKKLDSVISGKITNQATGQGFNNVKITLYEASTATKIGETSTAVDGTYKFGKLEGNTYYMQMTLPNGYIIGESNAFWGDTTGWLTVDGTNTLADQNASLVVEKKSNSAISGKITNQETGLGFSNVKITLFEAGTATKIGETNTAADGTYQFSKLEGKTYYMQMTLPNGYIIGTSNVFSGDKTGDLKLDGTNTLVNQDAALILEKKSDSVISGKITNQDMNSGFGNVKITLYEAGTANKVAETNTAADGKYQFSNLEANIYYLQMTLPNGYIIGSSTVFFGNKTGDLKLDGTNTLANQNAALTLEKKSNSAISGKITNQETGLGFSNVKITLFEAGTATKISETNTAANGTYQFSKLEGNIYYMQMTLPNGYIIGESTSFFGDKTGDLKLDGTNTLANQNAALTLEKKSDSIISGKITNQDTGAGFGNVKITLYEAGTATKIGETSTAADGTYKFSKLEGNIYYMQMTLPDGFVIGSSTVFFGDKTGDLRLDGTNTLTNQDASLKPIIYTNSVISGEITGYTEPIKVTLFNETTGQKLAETNTAVNGSYKFEGLGQGKYYLTATMPKGYIVESTNSFIDGVTGSLSLDGNSKITNLYTRLKQANQSAIQGKITNQANGLGVSSVALALHNASNGQKIAEVRTRIDGSYDFTQLTAGKYYVTLELPENYFVVSGAFTNLVSQTIDIDGLNKADKVDAVLKYEVLAQSITVTPSKIDTTVGGTGQFTVNFTPSNVTDKTVTYRSQNESIIVVDQNGKYTATGVGVTIITVTTANQKSVDVPVTVKENHIPVTDLIITPDKLDQFVGDTGKITAIAAPSNATNKTITFTSNDTSVMTVDNTGKWTAVGVGSTIITVQAENITKYVIVTVKQKDVPVTGIELISAPFTETTVNATGKINAKVLPGNATNQELTYESEDSNLLTVDASGNWRALKEGSLRVKITSKNGMVAYASFAVSSSNY